MKFDGIQNTSILDRKPNLKLCGNHFKTGKRIYRVWNSKMLGTAISDGKGWYIEQKMKKAPQTT